MNVLAFLTFAAGTAYLLWVAAVLGKRVSRHYAQQAEVRRLTAREIELAAELARQRERRHQLTTSRDFAASEQAGYVDRTGLEA